jgi:hypothetical protein
MSKSKMKINEWGTKVWRNRKGILHRTNGPAAEYADGSKEWWVKGRIHRIDGPAVEWSNNHKEWWVEGKCLGHNKEGFWALWGCLSDEDRANPTLLSYLPEKF